MSYAVQVFVGSKFGGGLKGSDRFSTEAEAEAHILAVRAGERRSDATQMKRRVVRA